MVEHFRRTDPRYDRRVDVEVRGSGRQFHASSRNVSLGGIFIVTSDPLPELSTAEVKFSVPTQPEPVEVTAEVRWIERGADEKPVGMGLRFHGLRARDVWALNRFFQT